MMMVGSFALYDSFGGLKRRHGRQSIAKYNTKEQIPNFKISRD